jgi:amidase
MQDITYQTASEMRKAIRRRAVSVSEVVEAHLNRISRCNPALNAIVTVDEKGALRRAREADEALERGESWGPLHGVPFTLKDCLATAGVRTTAGHPPLSDHVPAQDSTVAARLKAAGAILLGKTNVPPLAMSLQTNNAIFGCTNNPWDHSRTVGGSSGGAAAAVAAGLTPFDIGSDMSGSIRIPAHYCGVFGLKPTANRIPITGHIPPLPGSPLPDRQMCVVGPITRSVADLALVTGVLAGPDGINTEVPPVPWVEQASKPVAELRIAYMPIFPGVPTARAVRAAVERVATQLAAAGARVEERDPGVSIEAIKDVWREYFPLLMACLKEVANAATPVKTQETMAATVGNWARVLARRDGLISAIDGLFNKFDVFLCPAVISPAFQHSPPRTPFPVDEELVESRYVDHYLYPFNLTGHPALAIPAGSAEDGLPIGVQLIGRRWQDEHLLATAHTIVSAVGGFRRPPEPEAA